MKTFKNFLEQRHWRDWPPEEPVDVEYQQFVQQEEDLEKLKQMVADYNRCGGSKMSIATSGENHENPRDSDHFVLYIDGQEITKGDVSELMQRIRQISREEGANEDN